MKFKNCTIVVRKMNYKPNDLSTMLNLVEKRLLESFDNMKKKYSVKERYQNDEESKKRGVSIDKFRLGIMTDIIPFNLNEVELKTSNITCGGRGVFAKHDIKCGDLITFYPADIVSIYPAKGAKESAKYPSLRVGYPSFNIIKETYSYCFNVDETYSISGHPKFDDNPSYMGHFINDRVKLTSNKEPGVNGVIVLNEGDVDKYDRTWKEQLYMYISVTYSNCKIQPIANGLHTAVIAVKDIKKGDELYTCYGINYWNSKDARMKGNNSYVL